MKDHDPNKHFDTSHCNPETGVCGSGALQGPADLGSSDKDLSSEHEELAANENSDVEMIYVGDPMCSWCYGISPSMIRLRDHFIKEGIAFRLVVGGLRPGGGDRWDARMKSMLRHHWDQVKDKSGRPFGYALFDLEDFDYDTEPACRAVVASRSLAGKCELEFFDAISHKFYVDSQDPKESDFYQSICKEFSIDFEKFKELFESGDTRQKAFEEFDLNRQWGVQGYPTVLLSKENKRHFIAQGFSSFEQMLKRTEEALGGG